MANPTPKTKGRKRRTKTGSRPKVRKASAGSEDITKRARRGEQENTSSEEEKKEGTGGAALRDRTIDVTEEQREKHREMQIQEGTYDKSQMQILKQRVEDAWEKSVRLREDMEEKLQEGTRIQKAATRALKQTMEGEE